jgi:hypothetical protein
LQDGEKRQTKPQVQHKVANDQYYARGNAHMHQHCQAKIQDFSNQTGYQKISFDMALRKRPTPLSASKVNYWNIAT